nr:DUF1194 domain-containing protein [Wenxinia saemankumensis]
MRAAAGALPAALLCAGAGTPAAACRLALVLALDVSSSVDEDEDRLQRQGLAAALLAPEVSAAVFSSPDPVAVTVFEWSGRWDQVDIGGGWILVEGPADLTALAGRIAESERSREDMPTAMGYALGHAVARLAEGPDCLFRTIDLSTDGPNNEGFGPRLAYDAFAFAGITVNAMVIGADEPDLVPWVTRNVPHGPGAFVEVASDYAGYERAMRRKLVRELSATVIGALP